MSYDTIPVLPVVLNQRDKCGKGGVGVEGVADSRMRVPDELFSIQLR